MAAIEPFYRDMEASRRREEAQRDARAMPPLTDAQAARVASLLALVADQRPEAVAS